MSHEHAPGNFLHQRRLRALLAPPARRFRQPPFNPSFPAVEHEFGQPVMDRAIFAHALLDQNEGRFNGRNTQYRWDGQGWVGTDYDKLWIKSEGSLQSNGVLEDGRHEFLYDRAITTYFDLQGGLRTDLDSRPTRNWAAFGIQGLAPLLLRSRAHRLSSVLRAISPRVSRGPTISCITHRLILQPEVELNFYSQGDPAREVGAGLSDIDAGLRLRYEFTRKFAPYVGVAYEGNSARPPPWRGRPAKARAACASPLASGSGSDAPGPILRTILEPLVVVFALAIAGVFAFIYSGAFDVAATEPHWPVT